MVGIALASATAPKERKIATGKPKALSKVELAKAMAEVSDDDF